jgi:hypothetical protein
MAMIPKRRYGKGTGIDKTVLTIGTASKGDGPIDRTDASLAIRENPRIVNPAFRASARGRVCDVFGCGRQDDSVVGAHIRRTRPGMLGAGATKPSDSQILFLCAQCHDRLDGRTLMEPDDYIDFLIDIISGFTARRELAFRRAQSAKARTIPLLAGRKLPGFC